MSKELNDYIIGATALAGTIRAFAASTGKMVQKAHKIHLTAPVASAALGRVLTAAALMSRMLKNEKDTLTIQIKADGLLGGIVTVSDYSANVRGYVYNPDVHIPLKLLILFHRGRAKNAYKQVKAYFIFQMKAVKKPWNCPKLGLTLNYNFCIL
jgi:redox-regulated HSP33 family molecular chaperone